MKARIRRSHTVPYLIGLLLSLSIMVFSFDNSVLSLLLVLLFSIFVISLASMVFGKKPRIAVEDIGISLKKTYIPFSKTELLEWKNIAWIEFQDNNDGDGGTEYHLLIDEKYCNKIRKINIGILNIEREVLIDEIRSYARKYNVSEFKGKIEL